ncbi:MAG TPA: oxidoreductase [Acidimicrobiaceae bacterium]|jgi:coenzyme F420-reducing hydrogenase gamma subunit|nr:oxidoreductase [Acidimicrobiaceae bacterium]
MTRPTVAVWKFASCDGCQLTILDCEDELLAIAAALDFRMFLEAGPEEMLDHFDISLVEGSITTNHDAERIREVRERSGIVVTIGACATAGGIQALRNYADVEEYTRHIYARPDWIDTLATSTPIAHHIKVDHELHGCPINKEQLIATITALLAGRRTPVTSHSVCVECKQRGTPCLLVSEGTACLGPVTHAGCGALCPSINRGCFGCFGPSESANLPGLLEVLRVAGNDEHEVLASLRTFNVTKFDTGATP